MRILLVDDSRAVRGRLASLMADVEGLIVAGEAENAADALTFADRLRPDAVVLDLHMPGRNGLEILPMLKNRAPSPIVIVLTNHPDEAYRKQCVRAGADYFFDKSTHFDAVVVLLVELARTSS